MNRNSVLCASLLLVGLAAMPAGAGIVALGGGWQASWDSSLDPYVDINPLLVANNAIFIQKSAQFIQGPVNGVVPSIPIVFQQVAPSEIEFIVIDDEIITNSTGVDWVDFHIDLLDGGDAWFDPVRTAQSGGGGPIGFTIAPFTLAAFTTSQRLDIWGGVVGAGQVWYPGDQATDGQLWIGVNSPPPTTGAFRGQLFVLKETPTIPEPATVVLLALGGLLAANRRRA
jgi:hypothetical protein